MNRFSQIHLKISGPYWHLYKFQIDRKVPPHNGCCQICFEELESVSALSPAYFSCSIMYELRNDGNSYTEIIESVCEDCAFVISKIVDLHRKNSGL